MGSSNDLLQKRLEALGLQWNSLPKDVASWQDFLTQISNDITNLENQNRGQSQKLTDALNAQETGFAIFDADLNLLTCNKVYQNIYALPELKLEPGVSYTKILRAHLKSDPSISGSLDANEWLKKNLTLTNRAHSTFEEKVNGRTINKNEISTSDGGLICLCMDITDRKKDYQLLLERERTLRALIASIEELILEMDHHLFVRNVWCSNDSVLFKPREEVLGKKPADFLPTELSRRLQTLALDTLTTGKVSEIEYPDPRNNGRWYRGRITRVQGQPGEDPRISLIISDITQHRVSRERFRIAMSSIRMGVWEWDLKSNEILWDDSMYDLFGFKKTESQMSFEKWKYLIHPDDLDSFLNRVKIAIADLQPIDTEYRIIRGTQEIRTVAAKAYIERTADGKAHRLIGINYDITDQRRAQEEINTLSSLVESSEDIVAYWDLEGQLVFLNKAAKQKLGWRFDKNKIYNYLPENHARLLKSYIFPGFLEFGKQWEGETELLNPENNEKILAWQRIFSLRDEKGEVQYVATVATDIRHRKAAEIKLIQSSKMASLGEMAGGIAHEINNPVAIIKSQASQLRRAPMEKLTREYITHCAERIERTTDRIDRIIKGLKVFSRNAEKDPFIEVPLRTIVEETLELCKERFQNHNVGLQVDIESTNNIQIECRSSQISQVLLNLLNNAHDAIIDSKDAWVKVNFEQENGFLIVSVTDSGLGIPSEIADKLMEPFFTTKEVGKGTGLGLSISKGIADEHGGKFYLDRENKNTCFILELPIKQSKSARKAA